MIIPGEGLPPIFDLALAATDLQSDEGLESAVIISLFTDRRANDDDAMPDGSNDMRGYWGDVYPDVTDDLIGSRLWLLWREKITQSLLVRVEEYARESLQWLLDDEVASQVDISVERHQLCGVALSAIITRANGMRWEKVWVYQLGSE